MATLLSDRSGKRPASHIATYEPESAGLGEMLRRARERRGLTLEQIANETKIPRRHLEALEHDNLAALPDEFYRRAEIRAYARAVKLTLDRTLAPSELDRAVRPPLVREAAPEAPQTQEPTLSRKRVLIVIGVVVAAAVLGRAMAGRLPAPDGDARAWSASASLPHGVATVQPSQAVAEPPSKPSDGALTGALKPTEAPVSAASTRDLAVTMEPGEARVSTGAATELVVTTQPAGARVTVNGIGWGIAPVTIRHLPAGEKRIRVIKEGYASQEEIVHVAEGRQKVLDIQLRRAP